MTTTNRREKFEELAQQAEQDYRHNSKKYKNKIRLLVLLGYGYIVFILAALLGIVALSIFLSIKTSWFWLLLIKKKLIIILVVLIYVLFKALFIKIPAPEGYRLNKKQAPELFKHVNVLRKSIKAPKIHEIIITTEFNAAVQQTPRLGLIGWQKNSLILGLPLLMTLSDKQTLSVIAHEFGHLAGAHTKFNGWVYRARTSWIHIATGLQLSSVTDKLFGRFMNWYAPYFSAYTFALARANEFEADKIACQLTNKTDLSMALTKTHVLPQILVDKYWQKLQRQAYINDQIEEQSFSKLYQSIQDNQPDEKEISWFTEECMRQQTNYSNTHPSLADRLKPLNAKPMWDNSMKKSAINTWFNNKAQDILKAFDQQWKHENQQSWEQLYQQGQNAQKRLQLLKEQSESNDQIEQMVEQAQITHFLFGKSKADPLYKKIFEIDPKQPEICLYFGSQLLCKGDHKGLDLLQPLMNEQAFIIPAGEVLYDYFIKSKQHESAKIILEKIEQKQDTDNQFYHEINTLTENDKFHQDDLNDEEYAELNQHLAEQELVTHLWIAKKPLDSYPEQRMHIIVYQLKHHENEQSWLDWLEQHWPVEGIYFSINMKQHKKLTRKIIKSSRKIK